MLKLLFTLGVFLTLGLALLGLRTQRLEITADTARLRQVVNQREQQLWGQDIPIAQRTNPLVLVDQLKASGMELQGGPGMPAMAKADDGKQVDPDRDLTAPVPRKPSRAAVAKKKP